SMVRSLKRGRRALCDPRWPPVYIREGACRTALRTSGRACRVQCRGRTVVLEARSRLAAWRYTRGNTREPPMKPSRVVSVVGAVCGAAGVIAGMQPQPEPAKPQGEPGKQPEAARPDSSRGRQGQPRAGGELTSVESAMKLVNRSVRRLKG